MSDDELIAYLREWRPSGAWDAPSVERGSLGFSRLS